LATGEERAIRLVDLVAGKERAIFKTWGPIELPQIAFQPDGKWLTATGYVLKTWDLRAALVPQFDEGHTDEVTAIAYAPDGMSIASASEDRTVKIWDLARRKPRLTLRGHEAEVTSVVYTPDGKSVITASLDRTVRIWDASDGKERAKRLGHTLPIVSAAVSPDGRLVASAGERKDRYVELFTPAEPNGHPAISVAKPAPDFGEVKLWDIATGRLMATPLDSARPIKPEEKGSSAVFGRFDYIAEPPIVTFSPSGSTLAIGRADGSIDLWDIATRRARTLSSATKKDSFSSPDILCLSYSPDGRR
jgi:WD40 repeat protein